MFESLQQLFRGDLQKVGRALKVLELVMQEDLVQLDRAHERSDWVAVGQLAHRMKSGCMQAGQHAAANALVALEHALTGAESPEREFAMARNELVAVLIRVREYLAQRGMG